MLNLSLTDRSVIFKDAKDFLFCFSCLDTRETFLTPIPITETLYKIEKGEQLRAAKTEYILNVNLFNVRGPNHN